MCFLAKTPLFYNGSVRPRCRQTSPSSSSPHTGFHGVQALPKQPHGSRNQGWVRPRKQALRRPILGFRSCGRPSPPGFDAHPKCRTAALLFPCFQQGLGRGKVEGRVGRAFCIGRYQALLLLVEREGREGLKSHRPFCRKFEREFKAQ